MRLYQGAICRTALPHGPLVILVSTRLAWRQRTMHALFSPELEAHLLNLGANERNRIGLARAFMIEARAEHADSWQRLTWDAGSHRPDWHESQAVDPPFDTEN